MAESATAHAGFSLELVDEKGKIEYFFYVLPDSIDYISPARITTYQSINGYTSVDHLGEGIASINISGTTGWRLGSTRTGLFAYHSYAMLRALIDRYYSLCKDGKSTNETLKLYVGMPDAPNFGQWYVSVRNMTLKRSSSAPMLFQYGINFVCLSSNLINLDFAQQQGIAAGLKSLPRPKPQVSPRSSPTKVAEDGENQTKATIPDQVTEGEVEAGAVNLQVSDARPLDVDPWVSFTDTTQLNVAKVRLNNNPVKYYTVWNYTLKEVAEKIFKKSLKDYSPELVAFRKLNPFLTPEMDKRILQIRNSEEDNRFGPIPKSKFPMVQVRIPASFMLDVQKISRMQEGIVR